MSYRRMHEDEEEDDDEDFFYGEEDALLTVVEASKVTHLRFYHRREGLEQSDST